MVWTSQIGLNTVEDGGREMQLPDSYISGTEGDNGIYLLEAHDHLGDRRMPYHESDSDGIQGHKAHQIRRRKRLGILYLSEKGEISGKGAL